MQIQFSPLGVATLATLLSALSMTSCSSHKAAQPDTSMKDSSTPESSEVQEATAMVSELDALEAHYDEHSRQVVERDHFEVLNSPKMVKAMAATSLQDDEDVLGVALGGEALAYPIGALGSSELVNAVCGGIPIAASW